MKLVVGLGNPGRKYEGNRHNVGFVVVDELVRRHSLGDYREKFAGNYLKGSLFDEDVAVLKPETFMNLSGDSVQPAQAFLKIEPSDVIVVHDEIDLPWKDVRIKVGGGHAGNNGIRSLIDRLGTPDFVRVRVGVGRPPPGFRGDVADFVLQNFDAIEKAELGDVVAKAVSAVEKILKLGLGPAMNEANSKAPPRNSPKKKSE